MVVIFYFINYRYRSRAPINGNFTVINIIIIIIIIVTLIRPSAPFSFVIVIAAVEATAII